MGPASDGVPGAYRPLLELLLDAPPADITLTLSEVESILGFTLPASAHGDLFWWRGTARNSWARSWLRADRKATLNREAKTVTFAPGVYSPRVDHEWSTSQRRKEEIFAREALRYGPEDWQLRDRWWEPHLVYVLHVHSEALYKVGVTRHDTRRIRDLTARGRADVVSTLVLANRHAARLVEIVVLDLTESARRAADPFNHHNGQTEHWDDSFPPPELEPIAQDLARDLQLKNWNSSR